MAQVTVKPSGQGGDYTTLAAACSASNDDILIDGTWSSADTTAVTVSTASTSIAISSSAKHSGFVASSLDHYALNVSDGNHCITVSADNCTIDGLVIKQNAAGASDEAIRVGGDYTFTVKNSILWSASETSSDDQDGIYAGLNSVTVNVQNCIIYGWARAGCHAQLHTAGSRTQTWNLDSCIIWSCGDDGDASAGGISVRTTGVNDTTNTNIVNTIILDCSNSLADDYQDQGGTGTIHWSIDYSIDSDNTIVASDSGGSGNLASRTATDSTSPGVGDWVIFEDITSSPYDLRLYDNDTDNDAQDAGATTLSTDIIGTSRPQNSVDDIGAFEIAVGGESITPGTGTFTFTGGSITPSWNHKLAANGGSYSLTGGSITPSWNHKLASEGGSFTFTGGNTLLQIAHKISLEGGSFTFTGGDTTYLVTHKLVAGGSTFTFTGGDTTLTYTPDTGYAPLNAEVGSFTLIGGDTALQVSHKLTTDGGSFTFTGGETTLVVNYVFSVEGASYVLTGGNTTLVYSRRLVASGGDYTLTGGDAILNKGHTFAADGGSYIFTGGDVEFSIDQPLAAQGGTFTFTGGSTTFTYTRDACVVLDNDYYGPNILHMFDNSIIKAHQMKYTLDQIEYDIKLNACNIINPTVETIQFDTDYVVTTHTEGLLHWDDDSKTLELDLETEGVALQMGQEMHIRCTNKTGVVITNGQVVYVNGAQGQRPTIDLADADDGTKAGRTIGIATHDIVNNSTGYVTVIGLVNDVDTTGPGSETWAEGELIYVSSTAGDLTNITPVWPSHIMRVGYVIYSHATEGKILVSTQKGQHLEHLYEVDTDTNLIDGQILKYDSGQWFNKDIYLDTVGFEDRTESTMSFTDGTRTFSIEPTGTDYNVYTGGESITKDSQESVMITDTEGLWFFYFESDGVLTASQTPWNFTTGKIFIAVGYWNATSNALLDLGEERHGIAMSPATHHYLHDSRGAVWISGATPSVLADESGALDSHAELQAISASEMYDEDIENVGAEQLTYEIWYKDGATANWRKTTTSTALVDVTATRPNYNEWTGTVWQRTEVDNTKFMLVHQFLTNGTLYPNKLIMGENQYNSKSDAQDGALSEQTILTTGSLPTAEFIGIATFIIECKDSLTNSYNARVVTTDDGGDFIDFRTSDKTGTGASSTDHGNLAGLTNDDHPQYPNIADIETITGAWTFEDILNTQRLVVAESNAQIKIHDTDATDPLDFYLFDHNNNVFSLYFYDDSTSTYQTCFKTDHDGIMSLEGLNFDTSSNYITRQVTDAGYFVGSHNISSTITHSNPIFTLGTSYLPGVTTLGNLYGVGYASSSASFINSTDLGSTPVFGWGMYMAVAGIARIWLNGTSGDIHCSGDVFMNSPILTSSPPAAYNSAGVSGEIAVGGGYLYSHNGTRWGRVALDFTTTW